MPASRLEDRLRSLFDASNPPELGPGPRPGVLPLNPLRERLAEALRGCASDSRRRELIEAAVLLWHDHHEPAHAIVQNIDDADGSYLHAILHRREPDYGNARYWFRRVGEHVCFPELARAATGLLAGARLPELESALAPNGRWDAFAFVSECERVEAKPDSDPRKLALRGIQRAEFGILLSHLTA